MVAVEELEKKYGKELKGEDFVKLVDELVEKFMEKAKPMIGKKDLHGLKRLAGDDSLGATFCRLKLHWQMPLEQEVLQLQEKLVKEVQAHNELMKKHGETLKEYKKHLEDVKSLLEAETVLKKKPPMVV